MVIYRLKPPVKFNKKYNLHGHTIFFSKEEEIIINPNNFTSENINPERFYQLKNKYKIKNILLEDRISNNLKNRSIVGHVNRAGYNFLYKKTPFLTFPTFPDMSSIYKPIEGLETVTIHTLGPERFKKETDQKYVFSEIAGLISPVWHYINVTVFGKTV